MKTKMISLFMLLACAIAALTSCHSSASSSNISTSENKGGNSVSGSGNDTYFEMSNHTVGKQLSMQMLFKTYVSANGKARTEMYKITNDKPSLIMEGIADVNNPTQTTLLDDSAKTFTIHHTDTANNNDDGHTTYSVSKIGNETIMGFNCTHARVIATKNYSGVAGSIMNGTDTTDLWLGNDMPMPDAMKKYVQLSFTKSLGNGLFNSSVANQLKQMGCEGMFVKFEMHSKDVSSTSQLTKVSKDNFPASLFAVPSGYKEEKDDF